MYVCVCKGITEKQIKAAAANGTRTLRGLRMQLGVASQCGRCADCACQVLNEAKEQHSGSFFGGASVVAYAAPKKTP